MAERIVLTHVNLSDNFGTIERQTLLLIQSLRQRPLHQQLVVRRGSVLHHEAKQCDINIVPARWPWATAVAKASDLVHAHGEASWRWAAASKRPYIVGVHGPEVVTMSALVNSCCAVAPSRSLVEQLHARVPQLRVERIPYMFEDITIFPTETQNRLASQLQGKFVFGVCCSYSSDAGIRDAVEAVRWLVTRNASAHLLVVGMGRLPASLRAQVRSLDCITLLEEQIHVTDFYDLFDAYLSPAIRASDDNGVVQAMYKGLPIVATRLTAMDDFVQHRQSALLVASLDPHGLGEAMLEVMENESLALQLGVTARRHVEKCSPQIIEERMFRLYQLVASQSYRR